MPINSFLYPATQVASGYEVANSCRFDDGSNSHLSKSNSSSTANRRTFTFSAWVKRSNLGVEQAIWSNYYSTSNYISIRFDDTDALRLLSYQGGSNNISVSTNALYRDVSAWLHIVVAIDTTQSTSSNRVKIFVNGTQITSLSSTTYPSQNADLLNDAMGDTSYNAFVGARASSSQNFDGYIAEFVSVNGTALDATSFGEFDEDTGIWKPIDVSGLTFGTNGFYLDFEDSSSLGNDAAGSNNFTVNNLTSIDQSTDTCTNNFTTLNSLTNLTGSPTFSEGNLKVAGDSSANHNWQTTFVVSSGKWYWELKDLTSSPDGSLLFYDQSISSGSHPGYGFVLNTKKKVINGSPTGSAIGSSAQNDIWSMALDLDNGKMFIARNGTYLESGNPSTGANPFIQTSDGLPSEGVFGGHIYGGSMELNFGSPSFSISSGNSDANGYGNFEYSVPSGYYSICTKNLAEYG